MADHAKIRKQTLSLQNKLKFRIPKSIKNIGIEAFAYCVGLISINIPNSVTSIGDAAFAYCSGLTSVGISNKVTSIGRGIFAYCSDMTSVAIPNSVTSIGDGAFLSCTGLTSITIPSSVNTIGNKAFKDCTGLTSITIPNSVNSIGKEAFAGCSGLASITIPSGVTSIGSKAFAECSGLNSIVSEIENPFTIEKDIFENDVYSSAVLFVPSGTDAAYNSTGGWSSFNTILGLGEGGCIGQVLSDGTIYCEIGENYTATVKKGNEKHSGEVEIPNQFTYNGKTYTVTSIGVNAFSYCSDLTSITIPNSVTTIGDYAFNTCI